MARAVGATLIEVLIALVVLVIGGLALLRGVAGAARAVGAGRGSSHAASVAQLRFETLREQLRAGAPACLTPASGSLAHPDGVSERWSVTAAGSAFRVVVEVRRPGSTTADSIEGRLACL